MRTVCCEGSVVARAHRPPRGGAHARPPDNPRGRRKRVGRVAHSHSFPHAGTLQAQEMRAGARVGGVAPRGPASHRRVRRFFFFVLQECKKHCPVVRLGKLCVVVSKKVRAQGQLQIALTLWQDKVSVISEELCIGCNICTKKVGRLWRYLRRPH